MPDSVAYTLVNPNWIGGEVGVGWNPVTQNSWYKLRLHDFSYDLSVDILVKKNLGPYHLLLPRCAQLVRIGYNTC